MFIGVPAIDPKTSAKRVHGIHTSNIIGTARYDNHVDFLMGHCGRLQDANRRIPYGDHGLCPYFFNCAFSNKFQAVTRPEECEIIRQEKRLVANESFLMGWQDDRIE